MISTKYISIALCFILLSVSSFAHTRERKWSAHLTPEQEKKAWIILEKYKPKIQTLRQGLRDKMNQLKEFQYSSPNDHEALALLGQELQKEREALRQELKKLDAELMQKVGGSLHGYRGHDCNSLLKGVSRSEVQIYKHSLPTPHHSE